MIVHCRGFIEVCAGVSIIQSGLIPPIPDYDVHAAPAPRQCPDITVMPPPPTSGANRTYRILILGWNHTVPALLAELDSHPEQTLQVDLMSVVPSATRSRRIEQVGLAQPRMQLHQHTGDYAVPADVMALDLCSYHTIVIVGSDRLDTAEDADARTLLGHHLVSAALAEQKARPQLLVELREPANGDLFDEAATEVLPVGEVLSHVVAQIALRPDLRVVFDQLLGPGGPEIIFRPLSEYQIDNLQITFADLLELAAQYGEIALGIRRAEGPINGGVELNPARQKSLALALEDDLIVMTSRTYGSS